MKIRISRLIAVAMAAVLLLTAVPIAVMATGNDAPNGKHYSLNIHGVSNPKTADMDGADGHSIFVPETGNAKIYLVKSPDNDTFQVLDANGFDNDGASFMLPLPAECYGTKNETTGDIVTPATCTVKYTVWLRVLGKPNKSMSMGTCIEDPDLPGGYICSVGEMWVSKTRTKGQSKFENVSKQLLFVSADVDADGTVEHVQIFDPLFDEYYWQYNNEGVKLTQIRFYMGEYTIEW